MSATTLLGYPRILTGAGTYMATMVHARILPLEHSLKSEGLCHMPGQYHARGMPKCTAGPPRMYHVRVYIGFSYIKYSRTSFIPFYYITEVLNLRPH